MAIPAVQSDQFPSISSLSRRYTPGTEWYFASAGVYVGGSFLAVAFAFAMGSPFLAIFTVPAFVIFVESVMDVRALFGADFLITIGQGKVLSISRGRRYRIDRSRIELMVRVPGFLCSRAIMFHSSGMSHFRDVRESEDGFQVFWVDAHRREQTVRVESLARAIEILCGQEGERRA